MSILILENKFTSDSRFEITFYSDKEKTKNTPTEHGSWKAMNGKNELKTNGIFKPYVYTYTVLDENTVK